MRKGGGSAPAAPDPVATANAQAAANRVNIFTPSGNQVYGTLRRRARPETMTDEQFSQLPWDQQWETEVSPDHAAMTIQETAAQRQFREGGEGVANSLMGRARSQIDALPSDPGLNLPRLSEGPSNPGMGLRSQNDTSGMTDYRS